MMLPPTTSPCLLVLGSEGSPKPLADARMAWNAASPSAMPMEGMGWLRALPMGELKGWEGGKPHGKACCAEGAPVTCRLGAWYLLLQPSMLDPLKCARVRVLGQSAPPNGWEGW